MVEYKNSWTPERLLEDAGRLKWLKLLGPSSPQCSNPGCLTGHWLASTPNQSCQVLHSEICRPQGSRSKAFGSNYHCTFCEMNPTAYLRPQDELCQLGIIKSWTRREVPSLFFSMARPTGGPSQLPWEPWPRSKCHSCHHPALLGRARTAAPPLSRPEAKPAKPCHPRWCNSNTKFSVKFQDIDVTWYNDIWYLIFAIHVWNRKFRGILPIPGVYLHCKDLYSTVPIQFFFPCRVCVPTTRANNISIGQILYTIGPKSKIEQ